MDGGAWKAAVHGVTEGRTRLSDFTFTFHFHALEKEMATHSSVLAWRIPGTREPGGLPSMGSHRVGHDWSDLAAAAEALGSKSFPRSVSMNFIFSCYYYYCSSITYLYNCIICFSYILVHNSLISLSLLALDVFPMLFLLLERLHSGHNLFIFLRLWKPSLTIILNQKSTLFPQILKSLFLLLLVK